MGWDTGGSTVSAAMARDGFARTVALSVLAANLHRIAVAPAKARAQTTPMRRLTGRFPQSMPCSDPSKDGRASPSLAAGPPD